ncbi:MAG: hypothetical protein M9908_12345 [Phyllobacteriaceae bacterium]|nr:hypothetical protein [Phyllobacteriaceae bacterium]
MVLAVPGFPSLDRGQASNSVLGVDLLQDVGHVVLDGLFLKVESPASTSLLLMPFCNKFEDFGLLVGEAGKQLLGCVLPAVPDPSEHLRCQ